MLEVQLESEWTALTFLKTEKNGTTRFISDFQYLKKFTVCKLISMPKNWQYAHEIRWHKWATALCLNVGYCTIKLDPAASKISTMTFPWGKNSYKRQPMSIEKSWDIFLEKCLIWWVEYIQAYLDDLFILNKEPFNNQSKKLEVVPAKLHQAVLKVNAKKSSICMHAINYMEYLLTHEF